MRRVAMVTSGLKRGGSELQLVQVAAGLAVRGWWVEVISMQPDGPYATVLRDLGIPVHEVPVGRMASPRAIAALARCIVATKPDLVHTQAFRANLWGRLCAMGGRLPVIASVRATYSYLPAAYLPIERLLSASTDTIITPAQSTADHLIREAHVPAHKIRVIRNGVDTVRFAPRAADDDLRRQRQLLGRLVVLCPARLVPEKNQLGLIEAFAGVARRRVPATLLLAGGGASASRLEAAAHASGADVRMLGEVGRNDLAQLMSITDVVALMSDVEGMPNSLMEAMASGKAVIATAVDGVPELISPGVDGVLVPRRDVQAMEDGLVDLLNSAERRSRLGNAARAKMLREYDIDANVEQHAAVMEQAIDRCARRRFGHHETPSDDPRISLER